jgi:vacuolar-type H+-ATPase subunit E/Vma4
MKLTKSKLKQIIKEELEKLVENISNPPTDEELGSLDAGTILVGSTENKTITARKRENGKWDIFSEKPEVLVANPNLRGENENVTSKYITGPMGAKYTWEILTS